MDTKQTFYQKSNLRFSFRKRRRRRKRCKNRSQAPMPIVRRTFGRWVVLLDAYLNYQRCRIANELFFVLSLFFGQNGIVTVWAINLLLLCGARKRNSMKDACNLNNFIWCKPIFVNEIASLHREASGAELMHLGGIVFFSAFRVSVAATKISIWIVCVCVCVGSHRLSGAITFGWISRIRGRPFV